MYDIGNIDIMNLPLSAVFALLSDEYEERIFNCGRIDIDTIIVTKRGSTRGIAIACDMPDRIYAVTYNDRDDYETPRIICWEAADPRTTPENMAADIESCFE